MSLIQAYAVIRVCRKYYSVRGNVEVMKHGINNIVYSHAMWMYVYMCVICHKLSPIFSPAELLVDKAMELESVGGVYGANVQPTNFLCLVLKMLQIQPTKDIIIEFIKNPDYK